MELDKIEEVTDTPSKVTANRLLGEGWVLLDVKVVQLGNREGERKGGAHYILGRIPEDLM